jgi:hypothetical protein
MVMVPHGFQHFFQFNQQREQSQGIRAGKMLQKPSAVAPSV